MTATTNFRRRDLLKWMRAREMPYGMTATDIAEGSGIYLGHYRYDRCFDDLRVLEELGDVTRLDGRPARWVA